MSAFGGIDEKSQLIYNINPLINGMLRHPLSNCSNSTLRGIQDLDRITHRPSYMLKTRLVVG
ncbi:hypothetical protein SAMN05443144_1506 [Fodinibius roseus]|uniref:Uncharacterized protein n=1 Tax=Fodinibius roseus TaxID=1194090 RepID=A0A1M5M555_9BACT|nr:hypothetical protein SAMN05443144_1506 [Fodinibius roseus]